MLEMLNLLLNPLEFRGNYSATLHNMKLVHWPLMAVTFGTAMRGVSGAADRPGPSLLYQM